MEPPRPELTRARAAPAQPSPCHSARAARRYIRPAGERSSRGNVPGAAEAQARGGVARLERPAEGEAHEARVVLLVPCGERAGPTELHAIDARPGAAVARDKRAVEIQHPLPHERVQVVDTPQV